MENSSEHIIEQLVEALGELRSSIARVEEKLMLLSSRGEESVTTFDLSLDESDSIAAAAVAEAAFAIYGEPAQDQPLTDVDEAAGNGVDVPEEEIPEEIEIPAGMPEEENAEAEDPAAQETETEIAAETGDEAVLEAEEGTVAEEVETEVAEEIETAVETEVETEAAEAVEAGTEIMVEDWTGAEEAGVEEEPVAEIETASEETEINVPEEVEIEAAEEIEIETEVEAEVETAEAVEAVVEEQDDFGFFAPLEDPVSTTAPECINDEAAANIKPALMDVLSGKHAWKTDVPGPQVRNILSAISLNDRVLFINTLFGSNPMLFQETVSHLNSLENFTDAEEFISSNFSGWKFDSEPVYRFMMAIRRKLG